MINKVTSNIITNVKKSLMSISTSSFIATTLLHTNLSELTRIDSNIKLIFLSVLNISLGAYGLSKSNIFDRPRTYLQDKKSSTTVNYKLAIMAFLTLCSGCYGLIASTMNIWNRTFEYFLSNDLSNNFCVNYPNACKDNLGIQRLKMPQLEGNAKISFIKRYNGTNELIDPKQLICIQNEANAKKINLMIKEAKMGGWNPCNSPVLITQDNHILDGHHRTLACAQMDEKIKAIRLNLDSKNALQAANNHPGVEHFNIDYFLS